MTGTMPNQLTPVTPVEPPRRKSGARLSGGHLIMIVSGLAAFVLVLALFGRGQAMVTVAVATETIEVGEQVTPAMVKPVKEPKDSPLAGTLVAYDTIKSQTRYAAVRIEANTPIARSELTPDRARVEGEAVRQISIKVDQAYVANGKIAKNDLVDVISVSNEGVACRVVSGVRVTDISGGSGGALTSTGGGESTITIAVEQPGDDLKLATTTGKKVQLVRSTGTPAPEGASCVGSKTAAG